MAESDSEAGAGAGANSKAGATDFMYTIPHHTLPSWGYYGEVMGWDFGRAERSVASLVSCFIYCLDMHIRDVPFAICSSLQLTHFLRS